MSSTSSSKYANERLEQVSSHLKRPQAIQDVYVISASRTPTTKFNGSLATVSAPSLGAIAIKSALKKSNIPVNSISHVYMGNVLSAGVGQSPARQAAIQAGLPYEIDAVTVNKVCASGLKAVVLASQNIQLGIAKAQVAGGMESMSRAPYYLPRKGQMPNLGPVQAMDGLMSDGLTDAYNQISMGKCVEHTMKTSAVSREAQDEYAIQSYKRAQQAWKRGAFEEEIAPVTFSSSKGDKTIDTDEGYLDVNFDRLRTLKPAFEAGGSITAANASTMNDGASAVVLVNGDLARQYGSQSRVLARICGYGDAAVDPVHFAVAPAKAVPIALAMAGITKDQVAVWEFNEAFAAVIKLNEAILGLENAVVNPLGGAISLGHALGSSGSRILVTLLHQLKVGEYGVAAVCNGGGAATAMVVQRVEASR